MTHVENDVKESVNNINLLISGGLLSLWAFSNFIYGYWCSAKNFTPRFNYVYPWSAVSFITCSIVGYA